MKANDIVWVRARVQDTPATGDDCVEVWIDDKFHKEDIAVLVPLRDVRENVEKLHGNGTVQATN